MFPMLIAFLIFVVVVAATWWFGLWSNLITLVNLFIASLVASSLFHYVGDQIIASNASFQYLADFIAVWLVFVLTFMVLRVATDMLSSYRMKFNPIVEMTGRSLLSMWVAGVFVCFSMFTLQMAPLSPEFYGGAEGTFPDRAWLAFIQSRSRGALASSKSANLLFPEYKEHVNGDHPDDVELNSRVFDPHGDFLRIAARQRKAISLNQTLRVSN